MSTAPTELPNLSEKRVQEIEDSLFTEIARKRSADRRRRTGFWIAGSAAAAVIVVAAVIAPSVGSLVGGSPAGDYAVAPQAPAEDSRADAMTEAAPGAGGAEQSIAGDGAVAPDRDIITTASATVTVEDIPAAAAMIADAAASRDGYVESMSVGRSGEVVPIDPMTGMVTDTSLPYPPTPDGAWITVRVPAGELQSLIDQLSGVGEVTASTINRQDVTEVTLDLEARVASAQASVDRLTQLMAQATSLADLLAAESALAERQATLESYQQQLKYYDEQVAMSTLTVTLTSPAETVQADPAGFGDGLAAGWNGLVATLNAIVIAIGFLIPWIAVLAVAGLIVWGIVRLVRRRRNTAPTAVPPGAPSEDADARL